MRWRALIVGLIALAGCKDVRKSAVPDLTFDLLFPPVTGELMTISSPRVIDLNGDGNLEIVFGTGMARVQPRNGSFYFADTPNPPGHVVAVDGATNKVLWQVPHPGDAFTTPQFAKLNGDDVLDVVMGGREGALAAYSGRDGQQIWRVNAATAGKTTVPYNFFTPAVVRDLNGDGIQDLAVAYGGDDTKLSSEQRTWGFIVAVSGADGRVLASHQTPDASETYSAVVMYERPDGEQWIIFGTGGETFGGAAFRSPVRALTDGTFAKRTQLLIAEGSKGVMAPATLLNVNADAELDIVINTFDGRLIAVDGATAQVLWHQDHANEESYHSAAVMRVAPDRRPGLFVSSGVGTFPRYTGTSHRLYDAADGRVLFEYSNTFAPGGAPLAVDLDGDDIDEPFFFGVRYPNGVGGRIHVLQTATRSIVTRDLPTNYWTTPAIADARKAGTLELIGLSWVQDRDTVPDWGGLKWQMLRLDLKAKVPGSLSWAGYMGTRGDGRFYPDASRGRR